jgi:hypothetical protein
MAVDLDPAQLSAIVELLESTVGAATRA